MLSTSVVTTTSSTGASAIGSAAAPAAGCGTAARTAPAVAGPVHTAAYPPPAGSTISMSPVATS